MTTDRGKRLVEAYDELAEIFAIKDNGLDK